MQQQEHGQTQGPALNPASWMKYEPKDIIILLFSLALIFFILTLVISKYLFHSTQVNVLSRDFWETFLTMILGAIIYYLGSKKE